MTTSSDVTGHLILKYKFNKTLQVLTCEEGLKEYRNWVREELFAALKWCRYEYLRSHPGLVKLAMKKCGAPMENIKDDLTRATVVNKFCVDMNTLIRKARYSVATSIVTVLTSKWG